jgi:hypothetical protein
LARGHRRGDYGRLRRNSNAGSRACPWVRSPLR